MLDTRIKNSNIITYTYTINTNQKRLVTMFYPVGSKATVEVPKVSIFSRLWIS